MISIASREGGQGAVLTQKMNKLIVRARERVFSELSLSVSLPRPLSCMIHE